MLESYRVEYHPTRVYNLRANIVETIHLIIGDYYQIAEFLEATWEDYVENLLA